MQIGKKRIYIISRLGSHTTARRRRFEVLQTLSARNRYPEWPGRKGLCGQTISEIGCSNLAIPQGETTPVWTCARRSCLTLGFLPVDSWPQPGSPFLIFPPPPHLCPGRLTNSRPPGRPDLPTTSAQTSSLKAVWMRLCTF